MCKSPSAREDLMREAIDLAAEKMRAGLGGPFGALVVKDGTVIARGFNKVTSDNDPTAHAEVIAIREACKVLGSFSLEGCEIYSSCEPCPMCLAAIYWARIDRIFFANSRADAAAIGFDDDRLYREISKPLSKRSLPIAQIEMAEARAVFREWEAKPDKIIY